jgi:thiosulfate reductase/polysulfide reductase chain A
MQDKVKLPKYPLPDYPKPKSTFKAAHGEDFPFASQAVSTAVIDASIGDDAHYKGWLIYGTNLPMTVPGIRNKLKQAADVLELIVVIDTMPAEITGYADVILPECTYLERYDDLRNAAERKPSLALRMPAFEPKYDSKPGWWIAKQLGEKLGLQKYFPWKDYSEVLDWQLKKVGSSLQEMQKIGVKNFPRKRPMYIQAGEARRFNTPSGKIELYSQRLEEQGFDALPNYIPPAIRPENYYHLNYGRMPAHTFSRTTNNPLLFQLAPLQNQDGVVSNPIRLRVTERIGPDSVFMAHGFGHRSKRMRLTHGLGADDSDLMTNVLIDPIMGATGMRGNFVTFIKVETTHPVHA